ncbi:flagellin N-terminal-like domain-containing protein [Halogranum gelatinilyticum]|uniref:Flagellin N-terminal-like domain-containing protein n=1 Tax=Halogranum gelatinilyticum TaxID=660521 RepID=A0A1G9PJV3_9EURY|nr:type IV pilin [Halogranum gelatinilyticum]SDL99116.1 flagellin N-terminal-like domain-containing protein [Halogranum gelatinilyticum]
MPSPSATERAVSPVVGVALVLVVTVCLAAVVGAGVLATTTQLPEERSATPVALSLSVSGDRLTLAHRGGRALDVSELGVTVAVDGTELRHQPPVPFFSARGFRAGPTGPFNVASDGSWSVGETASVELASTNSPQLTSGATVTVRIVADGRPVARLSATV